MKVKDDRLELIFAKDEIVPSTGEPGSIYPAHADPTTIQSWDGLPHYTPYPDPQSELEMFLRSAAFGDVKMVTAALNSGFDPNAAEPGTGRKALHLAANNGLLKIVTLLIDRGADVDGLRGDGRTALFHAAEAGHVDLVHFLLSRGADPYHFDRWGGTPWHIARTEEIRKIFEATGPRPHPPYAQKKERLDEGSRKQPRGSRKKHSAGAASAAKSAASASSKHGHGHHHHQHHESKKAPPSLPSSSSSRRHRSKRHPVTEKAPALPEVNEKEDENEVESDSEEVEEEEEEEESQEEEGGDSEEDSDADDYDDDSVDGSDDDSDDDSYESDDSEDSEDLQAARAEAAAARAAAAKAAAALTERKLPAGKRRGKRS